VPKKLNNIWVLHQKVQNCCIKICGELSGRRNNFFAALSKSSRDFCCTQSERLLTIARHLSGSGSFPPVSSSRREIATRRTARNSAAECKVASSLGSTEGDADDDVLERGPEVSAVCDLVACSAAHSNEHDKIKRANNGASIHRNKTPPPLPPPLPFFHCFCHFHFRRAPTVMQLSAGPRCIAALHSAGVRVLCVLRSQKLRKRSHTLCRHFQMSPRETKYRGGGLKSPRVTQKL